MYLMRLSPQFLYMNEELIAKINLILKDKDKLDGVGVVKLNQLKKMIHELQQSYIKGLSLTERMITAIDQELKQR